MITDIRGHWAESWILAVARAGVLDPFENHTFQPRTVVRRVDFAQAMTRLLAKVAVVSPAQAKTLGERPRTVHRHRRRSPGVSRRVDRGGRRRDDRCAGRGVPAVACR